ncbi:DUF1990 family protein [Pseudonocardia oceani]|uniref:DUF1990 family protein n=1 Tax=Pseudonocardia oceani TaxID=2792013 RepID=UPI001CF70179|nr:DUF1990 family protein [Pseudonocardia oceani]
MSANPPARRRRVSLRPRGLDTARELDLLADLPLNFDPAQAPPHHRRGWHEDQRCTPVGVEAPGAFQPGGAAETAVRLIEAYDFSDPSLLRAAFRPDVPLLGRDMLLQGSFLFLRFLLGVRVNEVLDETREGPRGPERAVGWSYRTLRGHLEQGELRYEVVKELDTGRVAFRIRAHSRRAPIPNPWLRLGWRLFGRRRQLRFYRRAIERLPALVREPPPPLPPGPDGLVRAPAGAGPADTRGVVVHVRRGGR